MGICASSQVKPTVPTVPPLQCPEGYDLLKFKQILRLFDRLDTDGDFGVCLEELTDIADLHVENRIRQVLQQRDHERQQKAFELQRITAEETSRTEDVKEEMFAKRQCVERECARAVQRIEAESGRLKGLNDAGKSAEFTKALNPKGDGVVDFWTFFDYMRTRTADIKNIKSGT